MSRHVSLGKRVLAMALVLVLVLSYLPAGTFAAATKHVDAMTAVITRTGDAAPYTYTLTVTKTVEGNPENVVPDSVIWTEIGEAISTINTEITYESAAEEVAAEFTYGNLSGKVEYKAETANSVDYSAAEDAAWADKTVYVGVAFAIPTTTENGGITGAQLTTAANSENVDEVDGEYIPKKASDTPIVLLTQQLENNDDIMATKEYSAKVAYPALDSVVFKIGEQQITGTTWVNTNTELTIQVVDTQVVGAEYLPAVMVGDAAQTATWTGEGTEANPWSCTVAVDANTTVSLLDNTVTVNIDSTLPEITNGKAYVNGEGNTYVSFEYNADISGFRKVTVGGEAFTEEQAQPGKFSTTLSGEMTTVTVELTDVAGNVQTLEIPVQPKLTASVTASEAVNTVETASYYNSTKQLTLTVEVAGVTEGGEYDVASVTGTANEGGVVMEFVKGEDGKYAYTYTGADISLSGITVTVTDKMGRTATSALAGTYVYDTTAPTLELTATANGEDAGMLINGDKIYLGIDQPNGLEKVTFKIEGTVADANYQGASFCVEQECLADAVTAILVAGTIEDLAGNKLATVTLKAGENSCGIDVDDNGAFSKELLADLQKPYSTEATLEIIITDSEDADTFTGKLYNEDNLTFKAQIVDGEGAGINQVTYSLVGVEGSTKTAVLNAEGYYEFPIKDFLTNTEANVTLQVTASDNLNNQNSKSVTFAVDTKAPEAVANMPTGAKNQVDGVDYYDAMQTVVITVTDANFDAASTEVSYKINGNEQTAISWNGNVGTIEIADREIFSDLAYTIKDQAGHEIAGSKADKFCVDTTDPVVKVTKTVEETKSWQQEKDGVDYYNGKVTYTVEITDTNLQESTLTYKLQGEDAAQTVTVIGSYDLVLEDGQVLTEMSVYAKDKANNVPATVEVDPADDKTTFNGLVYDGNDVCVDYTDPTVKVTKTVEDTKSWQQEKDGVDYYNGKVTYTVEITDTNLQESTLTYKLQGQEEAQTVTVDGAYDLVLEDGQVLTEMSVYAKDKANNVPATVEVDPADDKTTFNGLVYGGNDVCVDYTDPTVKVTKTVEAGKGYRFTKADADYYNGTVTYTVEISDTNLQESTLTYKLQGQEEAQTVTVDGAYNLILEDGQMLTEMSVYAKDKANNEAKEVTVADDEGKTVFNGMTYAGRDVIVDATAPTATLDVSGDLIEEIYVDGGVIFVKLQKPTNGNSGEAAEDSTEEIVLEITVSDENLTLDENDDGYFISSNDNKLFNGAGKVNENATITYTQKLSVDEESHGTMLFALTALDLAGNELAEIGSVTINGEPSDALKSAVPVASGAFGGTIALDRRRPGSNDNAVPEIVITSDKDPVTQKNGRDLFDGAFNYSATIKDANAGLNSVVWEITNAKGVVKDARQELTSFDDDHSVDITIPVELKEEIGETNDVTLKIVATDNVGNVISYQKDFAIDTKTPVVTVTKSVENGQLIKENVQNVVDLYNGQVIYTVNVKDQFLTRDNGAVAVVRYRLEGDLTEKSMNLFDPKYVKGANSATSDVADEFEASFTLNDGDVLVALEIEVMDDVGHKTTEVNVVDGDNKPGNEKTTFAYFDDVIGKRNVYTGKRVAVDMTAPAVTITKSIESEKKFIQSIDTDVTPAERIVDFYDGMVTYTIRIEDQFMARGDGAYALVQYKVAGDELWLKLPMLMEKVGDVSSVSNNKDVFESAFTLPDGAVMTDMEIVVNDTIGHKATAVNVVDGDSKTTFAYNEADNTHTYTGNDVCVDKTAPVVSVEKTVEPEKSYIQSSEKTDYYNGEVTYKVTASDINLTNAAEQKQQMNLTYQFEGDEAATVIALPAAESGWTWQKGENGEDTYAYEFTVEDGKVLTKFEIEVVDNAGNKAQAVEVTDADNKTAFASNDGIWNYTGKLVAVDKTAPVITVEKTGTSIQSYDGHDYYAGAISYKVTVKDTFLNKLERSIANVVVTYMDGTKSQNVNLLSSAAAFGEKESDMDSYEAVFEVADGEAIKDIQIIAVDNADNNAKEVGVTDADNLTTFQYLEENRTLDYTGNVAVVDMTAPTAKVEITGQIVDSFYTYNGVTYVRLKNPGKAMSGEYTGQADETVTLKVTVSDKNLTLDTQNVYGVKNNLTDGIAWAGTPAKNQDGTVTYTKSVTVPADSTGIIEFSLTVFDLAGNAVSEVKVASINETDSTKINQQVQPTNGVFGTTISLDRRRPSSIDDSNAPVIVVKPSISNTISNNNLELFNGAFNFALSVTDGQNNANNSGIDKVQWIIEDAVGFVKFNDTMNDLEDGVYNQSFTIPVELVNAIGESNSVKITIIATDNVGNITEYVKDFAVDTQKPAVVVSYDNNDVMNGKYFKADRKVTITVSDINFEPTTTTITTQVNSTGWSKNGDVYTTTCTYNVDGIYTLDMVTTDRANNTADIDFTNNGINAAPTDFVLDKTAPVIDVSYSPANPVDRDGSGVHYFNANRNLTVTITEVNFDPANQTTRLVANLGANNALSAWRSNGDIHTASETFTEGNNYQVKIDYTDLAGNPAITYSSETFSVDLGEPTIEITSGELTNDGLNIVQDDLILGFTINDKQNNLKDFKATLLFLDKEFKQQEVTGAAYYTVAGENNRTTGTVTFNNIAKEKINDGIYTVQLTAEDYAGHKVELAPELVFSLNRFGSTFSVEDEATRQFLTASEDGSVYQNRASSLKIIERNPNKVYQSAESKEEGSLITISVNGNSIQLSKGVDYLMEVSEKGTGANKWYEYTYEILASNFFEGDAQIDGRYEILFYSVDAAGNSNTNESNEGSNIQSDAQGGYTGKLSFMLDHKAPVLSILDLNEKGGTTFDAAYKRVPISVSDNTPCTIEVYIDDVLVELKESLEGLADNANWLAPDGQGGYILNISASDAPQDVRVLIKDAAGNVIEQSRQRVLVSDSFWVRYINNYWAVGGTIAGLVALVVVVILLAKKGKKKEEQ